MKMTMIYGFHALLSALEHRSENIVNLYTQENKTGDRWQAIQQKAQEHGIRVQNVSASTLDKLAQSEHHQGFVAQIRPMPPKEEKDLLQWLETATRSPLL